MVMKPEDTSLDTLHKALSMMVTKLLPINKLVAIKVRYNKIKTFCYFCKNLGPNNTRCPDLKWQYAIVCDNIEGIEIAFTPCLDFPRRKQWQFKHFITTPSACSQTSLTPPPPNIKMSHLLTKRQENHLNWTYMHPWPTRQALTPSHKNV